jgi:hypothetical protein
MPQMFLPTATLQFIGLDPIFLPKPAARANNATSAVVSIYKQR